MSGGTNTFQIINVISVLFGKCDKKKLTPLISRSCCAADGRTNKIYEQYVHRSLAVTIGWNVVVAAIS